MQHIINIAFDFDDKRISEIAEKQYEEKVTEIIKTAVLDRIAPVSRWNMRERDWEKFDEIIKKHIREEMDNYKDLIIEKAATNLAESVKRSKAFKEKLNGL